MRRGWWLRWISRALLVGTMSTLAAAASEAVNAVNVRFPLSFRSWSGAASDSTGADARASQWIAPLIVSIPLSSGLNLLVQGAAQAGGIDDRGSPTLSGLTDTRATLVLSLAGGRLLLQSGLSLPTGPRELSLDEQRVAVALAPPFLGYRVRQAGGGLDYGAGVSAALPVTERVAVGFGAGALVRGRFRPLADRVEVDPGDEFSLSAGVDTRLGEDWRLRADATRRLYGEDDRQGGSAAYEEPSAWEGSLGLERNGSGWSLSALLLTSRKEESKAGLSPFSGTYLGGGGSFVTAVGKGPWRVGAGGEVVRFRGAESGVDVESSTSTGRFESTTAGFGPLVGRAFGERLHVDARMYRLVGDLDGSAIDGWDAQVALSWSSGGTAR